MARYPVHKAHRPTTTLKHFTGHSVEANYSHSRSTLRLLSGIAFLNDFPPPFFDIFVLPCFFVDLFLLQKGSELKKAGQLLPPCGQTEEHLGLGKALAGGVFRLPFIKFGW